MSNMLQLVQAQVISEASQDKEQSFAASSNNESSIKEDVLENIEESPL